MFSNSDSIYGTLFYKKPEFFNLSKTSGVNITTYNSKNISGISSKCPKKIPVQEYILRQFLGKLKS